MTYRAGRGLEVLGGIYTNVSPEFQRGICKDISRELKANKHDCGVVEKIVGGMGGVQEHQNIREDGLSPALTSAMGMGGGQTPLIFENTGKDLKQGKGIYVQMPEGFIVYAIWYEKEQCYVTIRKLTPKECFRLQGWTDDYFEKAAFVNSDSQLYKQAGNQVTVPVVYEIGARIAEVEMREHGAINSKK